MILQLINEGEATLAKYNIENPRLNSEYLLSHILKSERSSIYFDLNREITEEGVSNFRRLIKLRTEHIPLQHLVGIQQFRDLELIVGPGVFIPRPETEQLVSIALHHCEAKPTRSNSQRFLRLLRSLGMTKPSLRGEAEAISCLDIGTGTGAIPLAITYEMKNTIFDAIEISKEAFNYAERNLNNYSSLRERINLKNCDIFEFKPTHKYDLIISNPPYIPSGKIGSLPKDVSKGDPLIALDGGAEGIEFISKVADLITDWLAPNGLFLAEIGDDQGGRAKTIFEERSFKNVSIKKDLNDRDRFLIALGV